MRMPRCISDPPLLLPIRRCGENESHVPATPGRERLRAGRSDRSRGELTWDGVLVRWSRLLYSDEMANIDDFITQIGCAQKAGEKRNCTFIRVIHRPTGKERMVVGLCDESGFAVVDRLMREIEQELHERETP